MVADVAGLEAQAGGLTPGDSYLFTIAAYSDDAESEPGGEVPYQA